MSKRLLTVFNLFLPRMISLIIIFSLACAMCSCSNYNNDFDGNRFLKTKKITVLVDSATDFLSDRTVDDSSVASYIHDKVLSECNIDVEFIDSNELDLVNWRAADVSYTVNANQLTTFYRMGAVINLSPYLNEYSYSLSDLTDLLGYDNIHSCNDDPNEIWYLTPQDDHPDSRITFIRKDWLDKLGLEAPSDIDEFHNCLIAFRDNAELLLGEDAAEMIPFYIDSEPNISAKPLFDSFLDTSISDREFFDYGYCRVVQNGYSDGLKIMNKWYQENLLPDDFMQIRPSTKESYEPIENGYVGAFCSEFDYLFVNGENSHIKAFHNNCGEDAKYVAVNTFKNRYGEYVSWQEDYLNEDRTKIFLPSTCSEPLASLIYLNWISKADNIESIKNLSSDDPYTYDRYLMTIRETNSETDGYDDADFEDAKHKALEVDSVHRSNLCVRYGPEIFEYSSLKTKFELIYQDSTKIFLLNVICADENEFDSVLEEQRQTYIESGTNIICCIRDDEWEKVMVKGDRITR